MTQQTLTQSERRGYVQSQHVLSKHKMKNIIKLLPCRFQHCLGPFNMSPVQGCSEQGFIDI